jgi:two-component system CheB/CheR fusion protein
MSTESAEFTRLLEYLRSTRGFDFTGYKISSLMRRMRKRMGDVKIESYAEYTDYLEVHPDELVPLFNTVLINVTSFFRDAEAWQYVAEQVIPQIIADKAEKAEKADKAEKGAAGGIRIWSAGCASGQEAYTVAMLLAESLGDEAFKAQVKIYATDADEEALTQARQASYEDREVEEVSPERLARFFERVNDRHVFRTDLRRSLIFGRHDLVQDAGISRIDLLICRNVLMYFNVETQSKILARFHFALSRGGYLFLGKAETLLSHGNSFRPVDLKRRVFKRAPNANLRDRLLAISPNPNLHESPAGVRQVRLRDAAFDHSPLAQLVVDKQGRLVLANQQARRLFGLAASDRGRLLKDLEISYRPVDLRSALDQVYTTRTSLRTDDIAWPGGAGRTLQLELQITPVSDENGALLGASICFADLTEAKALKQELERAHQDLETAYEELQSANEELETTNEELQSTVEELETTNEELQSANEELETMNEELQSTNEELRTMNDQLHDRSLEVNRVNSLLESILGGLNLGIAVLDSGLKVQVWSRRAEDLWGLRGEEVLGKPFLKLDIGIPLAPLRQPIRDCLAGIAGIAADSAGAADGPQMIAIDGVNRRGKPIRCQVSCRLLADGESGAGRVLLVMEESPRASKPPWISGNGGTAEAGDP